MIPCIICYFTKQIQPRKSSIIQKNQTSCACPCAGQIHQPIKTYHSIRVECKGISLEPTKQNGPTSKCVYVRVSQEKNTWVQIRISQIQLQSSIDNLALEIRIRNKIQNLDSLHHHRHLKFILGNGKLFNRYHRINEKITLI